MMSSFTFSAGRTLVLAAAVALALAACGRRGPPEAPPDASVPQQRTTAVGPGPTGAGVDTVDDGEEEVVATPVPTPRPARNGRRGYTIPQDPFILDPLL
jgi:predicted small lipoprotein YifL